MYASDITRTYPANGRFSDPQKDLYTAVLNAQKAVLKMCTVENRTSMQELQSMSASEYFEVVRLTRSVPPARGRAATDRLQAVHGRPAAQRIGACGKFEPTKLTTVPTLRLTSSRLGPARL